MTKSELNELIDAQWRDFEGESGLKRFEETILKEIGYNNVQEFLADNPGAIRELLNFISGRDETFSEEE